MILILVHKSFLVHLSIPKYVLGKISYNIYYLFPLEMSLELIIIESLNQLTRLIHTNMSGNQNQQFTNVLMYITEW